jgi:hypothetical protein
MPITQVLSRGFAAAHGALIGALYLFLLHAPLQVLSAVTQGFQGKAIPRPEQQPDPKQVMLYLGLSFSAFVVALAVLFLYPLVAGGILGQVRDRLESPHQPPGPFGAYGRAFYGRLLGSEGLFLLVLMVILLPVMCLGTGVAFQQMTQAMPTVSGEGVPPSQPFDPQQLTRQLLLHPVVLAGMVIASLLMSAVSMVYWVANSIVVSEQEGVLTSWRKSVRFCRENFSAVLIVWLLTLAVGVLMSPFGLVGQLGIVKEFWALVALALLNAVLIAYWGMLLAGLTMSLYLARRQPSGQLEPVLPALV